MTMHGNYKNPTKTSFLVGQQPNRMGMMNDSPTWGTSPTAQPRQGVMVNYPKGAMPHMGHRDAKAPGKPPVGSKARDGVTTVVRGGGGIVYPKSDPSKANDSYRNKRFAFEEA